MPVEAKDEVKSTLSYRFQMMIFETTLGIYQRFMRDFAATRQLACSHRSSGNGSKQ